MSDRLDDLLIRLAAQTERAQQIWEAEIRADEDSDYDEDDEIEGELWLTLERDINGVWLCGYRVQQDEATVWALHAAGATPTAAALALLKTIEPPTSNPEYTSTEDNPF